MNRYLLGAAGLLIYGVSALADGRLEGRVAGDDGQYLEGALVSLPELGLEAATSADGTYLFGAVPAGSHELAVSYLGYPVNSARITIRDGQTARHEFALDNRTEVLVVYGNQAASTASALNQQRAADGIVSIVSATDIGQFPDQNVSEALQRVAGVFLERDQGEGRFVGIRGIDPNLIVTTINGVNVPAPENDKRSVALDVIPSELLSALEVSKSVTPDMDGDGIGGAVNIKSASAFDAPGRSFRFSAQSSYNQLQGENSPRGSLVYSDKFDLGNQPQSLGVAASMSWFDRNFGSENIETDGGWFDDLERTDGTEFKGAEEIEQRDYVVNRERFGLAANIDYRPDGGGEWYLRTLFSAFSDQEYRTRNEFKFDKGGRRRRWRRLCDLGRGNAGEGTQGPLRGAGDSLARRRRLAVVQPLDAQLPGRLLEGQRGRAGPPRHRVQGEERADRVFEPRCASQPLRRPRDAGSGGLRAERDRCGGQLHRRHGTQCQVRLEA